MKYIYYIVSLITVFTVLAITQDYTTEELLLFTALDTLILWVAYSLIVIVVLSAKLKDRTKYKLFMEESLDQCKADLESVELVAENQAKEIDNYDKMFKQQKEKHLATINLGDKVTRTNYHKVQSVYAMQLTPEGHTVYKLSPNSKWYQANEIRKID